MTPSVGGRSVVRRGVVAEFDEPRGLGVIADADGTDYPFHCTELLDGSRRVGVGTDVLFVVAAGHLGRLEARRVTSASSG